ncbi:MAG: helix-turn-helix domain-containing protein [Thermodesulfobacteriota bacterium]
MEKCFLNLDEISQYLNIKKSTVYSWAESGVIPCFKIGRLLRFKLDEVDHWIEDHRREGQDANRKAKEILNSSRRRGRDVHSLTKKIIVELKGNRYTPHRGRPDQVKGLRKGGDDGTL